MDNVYQPPCSFLRREPHRARSITHVPVAAAPEDGSTSSECESGTTWYGVASSEPRIRNRAVGLAMRPSGGTPMCSGPPPRLRALSMLAGSGPLAKEYERVMMDRACAALRARAAGSLRVPSSVRKG